MRFHQTKISLTKISTVDFLQRYQKDSLQDYCKACPKYDNCWSCPPLSLKAADYFADFAEILLIGVQRFHTQNLRRQKFAAPILSDIALRSTKGIKNTMTLALVELEQLFPQTTSLASGGCDLCDKCSRSLGLPCAKPAQLRYSIDAFGIDIGQCARAELDVELLWCKNSLPAYYFLVHAFLSKNPLNPNDFIYALRKILEKSGYAATYHLRNR